MHPIYRFCLALRLICGEVRAAVGDALKALQIARKLLESGWLPEFRVAEALRMRVEVEQWQNDEDAGDVDTLGDT